MNPTLDWRDVFCGRETELQQLISAYEAVASGDGPRFVVVSAERGMGKTRLVQELYRHLTTKCDPDNYWPDASLFKGNNLRVAPDFNDDQTKEHFASFKTSERPMPFLWWGFRLIDSVGYNAGGSDMAGHRRTLDPHLERALFARVHAARLANVKGSALGTIKGAAVAVGEILLDAVPGVGAVKAAVECAIGVRKTAKRRADARIQADEFAAADLTKLEAQRTQDIYERTLDDLALVLEASNDLTRVPAVVFCDDAQFARDGGDEGALRFLKQLWERAEQGHWPMLLVATHWAVDWEQDRESESGSFGQSFRRIADDADLSTIVRLPKESDLSALILQGLPGLPRQDVDLLLDKADGNPQVLIELVDLIRTSPVWREKEGRLTQDAREEIEGTICTLTELIAKRLKDPTKTPDEVRIAVALSSLQGMQFLTTLTEATADKLKCGMTAEGLPKAVKGLSTAANPLRLIVGLDAGVASFVQRAYREAAESLVKGHLGKLEKIRASVLETALAIIDDNKRWAKLDADKQRVMLGVMTSLADGSPDPAVQLRVGRALIQLVELATDKAQRASYAKQFHAGLVSTKWPIDAFTYRQLDRVRSALGDWYGDGTTVELCELILNVTRARQAAAPHPLDHAETDLEAALLAASWAQEQRGEERTAADLCREWTDAVRRRTQSDSTPENIDALCNALRDLRYLQHLVAIHAPAGDEFADKESAVLLEIVAIRRDQCRTPEPSAAAMDALISALQDLKRHSGHPPSAKFKIGQEIVELCGKLAAKRDDEEAHLDSARAQVDLAKLLHENGQHDASSGVWSEALKLFRELWGHSPSERVAEQFAEALKSAADQKSDKLSDQRKLLLEALDLLEARKRLMEAETDICAAKMERPHDSWRRRKYKQKYDLQYALQSALACNAASSGEWVLAREHCLRAAKFDTRERIAGLSETIQSQLPANQNWPSIDELRRASRQEQNLALDALRQRFQQGPDHGVCNALASILSDQVKALVDEGSIEDAEDLARECFAVESWGNEEGRFWGMRYRYTDKSLGTLCNGLRSEQRWEKTLQIAIEVVNVCRVGVARGFFYAGRPFVAALQTASEIAEAAGKRGLAVQYADQWLDAERRVVDSDRESSLQKQLSKPLAWRAELARRAEGWDTHEALQKERLVIGEKYWEAQGYCFDMLSAQLGLLDGACHCGDNNRAVERAQALVGTVRNIRDRPANWGSYTTTRLIETLVTAVQHMRSSDRQTCEELETELAATARDLLSKRDRKVATLERIAASLSEVGLNDEAQLFEAEVLAIRAGESCEP